MRDFLSASLLIVVLGAGCDRQHQAAGNSQPVDYFAKKRECYELASQQQRREQNGRAKPALNDRLIYLDPEQCFVPTMNTCIYESGFIVTRDGKAPMVVSDYSPDTN
jgi:hypothetical protein